MDWNGKIPRFLPFFNLFSPNLQPPFDIKRVKQERLHQQADQQSTFTHSEINSGGSP